MADNGGAIGWDDEVSLADAGNVEGDGFVVLSDGRYPFTVNKVERGSFAGSAKLSACNMVKVGIIVDGGDAGRSYITTRLFMHTKMLFKIFQFLEAVGLRKKGDPANARIPWDKVVRGLTGECTVKQHEYNGTTSNEVDRWIEKTEDEMPPF